MPGISRKARALLLLAAGTAATPARAVVAISNPPDPLLASLTIPADAARRGMWSPTASWPIMALHLALMPSGTVLSYGTPVGDGVQDGRTFDIWDPAQGLDPANHVTLPDAQNIDSFCSASAFMTSGAMLISGGSSYQSNDSSLASTAFDPARQTPTAVAAQLASPRWYGSMITLADGRMLVAGGGKPYVVNAYADPTSAVQNGDVSMTPEVYTPGSGWSALSGATSRGAFGPDYNRWYYPRMWVAPSGGVFGISSEEMWTLDPSGTGSIAVSPFKTPANANTRPNVGPTSTAVMYQSGLVLQVGGNGYMNAYGSPSSSAASIFDLRGAGVAVSTTGRMIIPRQWANSIVLPNGQVLVTGGSRYADTADANAVLAAEIWNPATGLWALAASAANYRGYHSATILLQDGTVLSTGGGVPGPVTNFNAEVYYPPYLFTRSGNTSVLAARPLLASISDITFAYGDTAQLQLASMDTISSVALIGLSATTHSFNSGQRYQTLPFTQDGLNVSATLPATAGWAPPGYYQIALVDASGVPSSGVIVSIGAASPLPVTATGTTPATSLTPLSLPGYAVRHRGGLAFIDPVSTSSPAPTKDDAAFFARPGLADKSCFSFESRNVPGSYLRSQGLRLALASDDGSISFDRQATFCRRAGLSGAGFSFESLSFPGRYIRNRNRVVWLDAATSDPDFGADASFGMTQAF